MNTRILIVEDEQDALNLMEELFQQKGYSTDTAQNGVEALERIAVHKPDIILSDVSMPRMDGMTLLNNVMDMHPDIPVILISAYASFATGGEAMRSGARDYIFKPLDITVLLNKVEAIFSSQRRPVPIPKRRDDYVDDVVGKMIGSHPLMQNLRRQIEKAASNPHATVLVRGANGAGKELVAEDVYRKSIAGKTGAPFLVVNCASLAETLLESEMFGHEKGAFTGADKQKIGKFEQADGGVIFLDEIGDIPPKLQLDLLRVLSKKEIQRVGGNETIKLNVRVIAATNRDLEDSVSRKKFREDLFYRLNVIDIRVPSLAERQSDIPMLANHFLTRHCEKAGKPLMSIARTAMERLSSYDWPGNVRQLENAIERAVVMSESDTISLSDLPKNIVSSSLSEEPDISVRTDRPLDVSVGLYEKAIIIKALEETGYNQAKAARKLDVHRTTLVSKMKKYDIFPSETDDGEKPRAKSKKTRKASGDANGAPDPAEGDKNNGRRLNGK